MVAIAAVQSKFPCVKAVVIADGLRWLIPYPGIFWSCVVSDASHDCSTHHAQGNDQLDGHGV